MTDQWNRQIKRDLSLKRLFDRSLVSVSENGKELSP